MQWWSKYDDFAGLDAGQMNDVYSTVLVHVAYIYIYIDLFANEVLQTMFLEIIFIFFFIYISME